MLPPKVLLADGGCQQPQHSLACSCIIPISALHLHLALYVSVSPNLSLYKDIHRIRKGSPKFCRSSSQRYICRFYFQLRPHSGVQCRHKFWGDSVPLSTQRCVSATACGKVFPSHLPDVRGPQEMTVTGNDCFPPQLQLSSHNSCASLFPCSLHPPPPTWSAPQYTHLPIQRETGRCYPGIASLHLGTVISC